MPPVLSKQAAALENHLRGLTVDDLQEILRGHPNLNIGGNKDDLVVRILEREMRILKEGLPIDHITVDDIRSMLRGHRFTIGVGKKAEFAERFMTNLRAVVDAVDVSDPQPRTMPKGAPTSKPEPAPSSQKQPNVTEQPSGVTLMLVNVPENVHPGEQMVVMTPAGQQFMVVVPPGAKPGSQFQIAVPPAEHVPPPAKKPTQPALLHGHKFVLEELKEMCACLGLKVSGNKPDLVQRLEGKMTPRQVELLLEFQKEALKVRVCSNAAATLRVCFPTHVDRCA